MQNRYVGDVGDFGKFALLRALCCGNNNELKFSLSIVWCLFPDEDHNGDGRHISYLEKGSLVNLDPVLHERLEHLVRTDSRSVSAIPETRLFPQNTFFFDRPIALSPMSPAERLVYRDDWLSECVAATRHSDLVFFDPDNGLETRSVTRQNKKAGKYIFLDEILPFVGRGQTLIVYHHTNRRTSVEAQSKEISQKLAAYTLGKAAIIPMIFRRGSCRIFFILVSRRHEKIILRRIVSFMDSGWAAHFTKS